MTKAPASKKRTRARTIVLAILTLLGLWVAQSFLLPLAWAAVIAIAIWPLFDRWRGAASSARRNSLSALLATTAAGLLLIFPLALVAVEAINESSAAAAWLARAQNGMPVPAWLPHLPLVGARLAHWWAMNVADADRAAALLERINANTVIHWGGTIASAVASGSLFLLITLAALFVMLKDGRWFARRVHAAEMEFLGENHRFVDSIVMAVRGTVVGTVFVALAEGALIGAAYGLAGLPRAILFGVATAAFAMLPFGAWFVFTAASAVLLTMDQTVAAIAVFVWGAIVMLVGDNLVQPALVGRRARLPFLFAMIGTFGGLEVFGFVGLFLGPVIMAALLLGWEEWVEEHQEAKEAAS